MARALVFWSTGLFSFRRQNESSDTTARQSRGFPPAVAGCAYLPRGRGDFAEAARLRERTRAGLERAIYCPRLWSAVNSVHGA
jgi:hypothetical protein